MKRRDVLSAGGIAAAVALMLALPPFAWLDGLSLDIMFWLRHLLPAAAGEASGPRIAVVAIDEETYRRPPFRDLPKALWTNQIARTMNAVVDGGARVVGFDIVFSTSVDSQIRGFDKAFLLALRAASRDNKVVLAKVQHAAKPIAPYAGYSFAVGHGRNIRAANLAVDPDGVVRRVPLWLESAGPGGGKSHEPSLSLELASRALGKTPHADGRTELLLNFDAAAAAVAVHSLADLHACAERGRGDYFRTHFEDRIVLFGAVLDVEDRQLTSRRFVPGDATRRDPARCVLPPLEERAEGAPVRDTMPGVFVHAAAISNILHGSALSETGAAARVMINLAAAAAVALGVLSLSPLVTLGTVSAAAVAWAVAATAALALGLALPLLSPVVAAVLTFAAAFGYRFAVADRDKRQIRKAFSLYLPPSVVDRLVDRAEQPRLGGEARTLTVLFSDMADFTGISEGMAPTELVRFLNRYLGEITDIVEAHGGIVDKYAGDGVSAIFGAPIEDSDHARHAVLAALACREHFEAADRDLGLPGGRPVRTRIGINSGEMLVGNIGSERRLNYTVLGDAVNLAARLEGVNKEYGTSALVSGATAALCRPDIVFREVDRIRVFGRDAPVTLYEPVARAEALVPDRAADIALFEDALGRYRAGAFAEARRTFETLSERDPVAGHFARRCAAFTTEPPPASWGGVFDFKTK